MEAKKNIPCTGKVIHPDDIERMVQCVRTEEIPHGTYMEKFEANLASYMGMKYAYMVNSGSSANLLAFAALTSPHVPRHLKPGDEVITIAASFPTTIAPIVQLGCVPVFVDITIPEYNIDVSMLEKALSNKTKAVFIAHTLGNPFDVKTVKSFCDAHNLYLIEDNCDAFSSRYAGELTGTFGDISTVSFYPAHHMTTGEGGAVFTNNPIIGKVLLAMRNWGRDCVCPPNQDNVCGHRFSQQHGNLPFGYDHKFVFSEFGYNLKSTNPQAALGLGQLEKIESFANIRHRNFALLRAYLANENITLPVSLPEAIPSWFGFPILLPDGMKRKPVVDYINSKGVQTRFLFAGNITKQPMFTNTMLPYRIVGDLYNTDRVMNQMFWVGVWHGLSASDIEYEAGVIKEALH